MCAHKLEGGHGRVFMLHVTVYRMRQVVATSPPQVRGIGQLLASGGGRDAQLCIQVCGQGMGGWWGWRRGGWGKPRSGKWGSKKGMEAFTRPCNLSCQCRWWLCTRWQMHGQAYAWVGTGGCMGRQCARRPMHVRKDWGDGQVWDGTDIPMSAVPENDAALQIYPQVLGFPPRRPSSPSCVSRHRSLFRQVQISCLRSVATPPGQSIHGSSCLKSPSSSPSELVGRILTHHVYQSTSSFALWGPHSPRRNLTRLEGCLLCPCAVLDRTCR